MRRERAVHVCQRCSLAHYVLNEQSIIITICHRYHCCSPSRRNFGLVLVFSQAALDRSSKHTQMLKGMLFYVLIFSFFLFVFVFEYDNSKQCAHFQQRCLSLGNGQNGYGTVRYIARWFRRDVFLLRRSGDVV